MQYIKYSFLSVFLLLQSCLLGQEKPVISSDSTTKNVVFFGSIREEMPRYYCAACEELDTENEKKKCAQKEMLAVVYENLNYPDWAGCIEGTMVIGFVVQKDGTISGIKVLRSLHSSFDAEGIRVVSLLKKWIPGRQANQLVDVMYNLPIRIRLD